MAYTQDEYDSVKAAILALATGTRTTSIAFGTRTVQYQAADLDKLQALLAVISADLTVESGDHQSFRFAAHDKGV